MAERIKQYLEWILIIQSLFALVLLSLNYSVGERLKLVTFLLLAGFYLISSVRVLKDRRVEGGLKLLYAFVLSGFAIGFIGVLFKVSIWKGSSFLLLGGLSASVVSLLLFFGLRKSFPTWNFQPLLYRAVPFSLIFLFFFLMSTTDVFDKFSLHKDDMEYREVLIPYFDNPTDSAALHKWDSFQKARAK